LWKSGHWQSDSTSFAVSRSDPPFFRDALGGTNEAEQPAQQFSFLG
jgi:hypothetical protein